MFYFHHIEKVFFSKFLFKLHPLESLETCELGWIVYVGTMQDKGWVSAAEEKEEMLEEYQDMVTCLLTFLWILNILVVFTKFQFQWF